VSTAALALVAAAAAQVPAPPVFEVDVEGVYVDAFVTDGRRPVVGLTADDFELRDDGVRRRIEIVALEQVPLSTFLVLDASGSVAGEKLAELQAAASSLVRGLRREDEAALVTFDEEVVLRVGPTSDRDRLEQALRAIRPRGPTALFDALYTGVTIASGHGRSLMVLFTDGEDNLSWLDADQLKHALLESDILLQAVGIVPPREPAPQTGSFRRSAPVETAHARTLRYLAEATGGRFWPASAPDHLTEAFQAILEAMKTRYVLRFEPEGGRREGLHQLELKLTRRKGTVHARESYFVGVGSR